MDTKWLMLQKAIITRLMHIFAAKNASKDLGYFLAVTTLNNIGEGKVRQHSGDILFLVDFSCITFKMLRGEVLEGMVHHVSELGVLMRCGPAEEIFLSHRLMADYGYVRGENPYFMNDKLSKIEKGVVVRFVVIKDEFIEEKKDFKALASIEGDYLGPVS